MDPITQKQKSPTLFIIAGAVVLVLILLVVLLPAGTKDNQTTSQNQSLLTPTGNNLPTPTYTPPPNLKFSTVDGVNFLPHSINDFQLQQTKLQNNALQLFPNLTPEQINAKINQTVFSWLALNEYYAKNDTSKVTSLYLSSKTIENFSAVQREMQTLQASYLPNVMKIDGFYMKLRFKGTLPSNLQALNKKEIELQSFARPIIDGYHTKAVQNKEKALATFNADSTVMLLNNREVSKSFKDYPVFPPLVGDVGYYDLINSLPVGQVSDVMTLTAPVNGNVSPEEYAYVIFYISKKVGTVLPIEALANQYVSTARIR